VIKSLVVGLYQPLADNRGEPTIRPNLSLAVASKDKEKLFWQFFFNLLQLHPELPIFLANPELQSGGQPAFAPSATRKP